MGICTVSLIVVVCSWIRPGDIPYVGRGLLYLTRISMEIFLYQFCILEIYDALWNKWGLKIGILYMEAVLISVIILAGIMHSADIWIGKWIKRSRSVERI